LFFHNEVLRRLIYSSTVKIAMEIRIYTCDLSQAIKKPIAPTKESAKKKQKATLWPRRLSFWQPFGQEDYPFGQEDYPFGQDFYQFGCRNQVISFDQVL
jgi:hypothetical protein